MSLLSLLLVIVLVGVLLWTISKFIPMDPKTMRALGIAFTFDVPARPAATFAYAKPTADVLRRKMFRTR